MKKLIATIIVLVILGVIVTVTGLIRMPANMYGVTHTAISGFDEKILLPGSFSWRWEKLIPTVLTTYTFNLEPYKIDSELIFKGDFFSTVTDHANPPSNIVSFDTGLTYMLEFSIIPEKLRQLVVSGLRPDKLADWYAEKASRLTERISGIILKDPQILTGDNFLGKISTIVKDDPQLDSILITKMIPRKVNLPDYELYLGLKQKSLEVEKLRLEAEVEKINAEKERDLIAIKKEIDIIQNLDRYGETFKNYPILLEFLYLRHLSPEEFLKLSEVNFSKGK